MMAEEQGVTFHDYNRTIIGFHGTSEEIASQLVDGAPFSSSSNDDDWFGTGIYFWEYAPKQAWWWARDLKKKKRPAVVGAIIRLGNCLDLLDPINVSIVKDVHGEACATWTRAGKKIPKNANQHKNLDCAVFNFLYDNAEKKGRPIETARAVYVPTHSAKRVWKRSWIYDEAHIQVCVRKAENILAVWRVRQDGHYGKDVV